MHARIGLSPAVIAIKRTAVFVFSIDFIQEYAIKQPAISCGRADRIVTLSPSHVTLSPSQCSSVQKLVQKQEHSIVPQACIVPNTLSCIYSCTFIRACHIFLFEPLIYSESCPLRASVQFAGTHTYDSQKIQFVDTIPHLNKTRAYFFSPLKLIQLTNTMK